MQYYCQYIAMTPKGQPRRKEERLVRTTVDMPETLWRATKIRAMDERRDLRAVILTALAAYLKTPIKAEAKP